MKPQRRTELAERLTAARLETCSLLGLPPELVPPDRATAYLVAEDVAQRLGWPRAGWKIAGTNNTTSEKLRTPQQPIYGQVFAPFLRDSTATLSCAALLSPLVECEIAYRLAADLPPREQDYSLAEVSAAVAAVVPAIEIAECRFPHDHLPPIEGILADHSASGTLVLGAARNDWRTLNVPEMSVSLTIAGRAPRHGTARDILGDPLQAVVWLANQRRHAPFDGLRAGEIVSTGTCTGMVIPRPGEVHVGDFGPLGRIQVAFTI